MRNYSSIKPQTELGFVMFFGLVLLLMLTVVGLSAIKGSGLQELMAGNIKDSNVAFQAAEAALREAEANIASNSVCTGGYTANTNGCYADQNAAGLTPVADWTQANWETAGRALTAHVSLPEAGHAPYYVIENIPVSAGTSSATASCFDFGNDNCATGTASMTYYRITAFGYGGMTSSQVVLQTTYIH